MILVTGGTGFIGRVLIRHLVASGRKVRTLIRPSRRSPNLPPGVPVEVTVCSLKDERGLRAAMKGIDTIYHLAGTEGRGTRADLIGVDIQGTQAIVQAASESRVDRFFFLSHLGADRASAYPLLKAKAIAENHIRMSGIDFTIVRSAVVFGPGDHFSTGLAAVLHALPWICLIPGEGEMLVQPLWVEDLVTCLVWALDDDGTRNQVYPVGGPEYLSFREIIQQIMRAIGVRRSPVAISPAYLRGLTVFMEHTFPRFPLSVFLLDYLASNRTCPVDTIPRLFDLLPAQFSQRLEYLRGENWQRYFVRRLLPR